VSVADANLFCRPGKVTGVVNADPAAFFFADTAGIYKEITTFKTNMQQ